jgi:2-hydroxy-3-oxopropionate reductase
MLPNGPQVKSVMLGENGVAAHMKAGSTVMNAKAPMMIAGNDKPGFKIDLHIKDLNNALDCAHSVGAPVPMTASVQEILQWMHNHEGGNKDHSAIAQYYEYLSGIQIGR